MANWKHAPLVYTLGMVQFPRVPDIGRFADKFLDRIRSEYPFSDCVSMPVISAEVGPQGLTLNQQESKIWQFLSVDKNWGFILNDQSLCLHTTKYHDFSDFVSRFKLGINALLGVPDIGVQWVTALGIRYVDMIVPNGTTLSSFLKPWVLPDVPADTGMRVVEGAYVARYSTDLGEMRLQAMRNPPFTLPPELQSPVIAKNHWMRDRPSEEFALVDTDHGITYSDAKAINVDEIISTLDALHLGSKKVFESMGTPLAVSTWRGE